MITLQMFSKLKVGDEVYSRKNGWQTICHITPHVTYPIKASMGSLENLLVRGYTHHGQFQEYAPDIQLDITKIRLKDEPVAYGEETTQPFKYARAGDMVWSSHFKGMVKIASISKDSKYPIELDAQLSYTLDGNEHLIHSEGRSFIFWQAPSNISPPRSLRPDEFIVRAMDLIGLAEKKNMQYSVENKEGGLSLNIQDMGGIHSSSATCSDELDDFERRLKL